MFIFSRAGLRRTGTLQVASAFVDAIEVADPTCHVRGVWVSALRRSAAILGHVTSESGHSFRLLYDAGAEQPWHVDSLMWADRGEDLLALDAARRAAWRHLQRRLRRTPSLADIGAMNRTGFSAGDGVSRSRVSDRYWFAGTFQIDRATGKARIRGYRRPQAKRGRDEVALTEALATIGHLARS